MDKRFALFCTLMLILCACAKNEHVSSVNTYPERIILLNMQKSYDIAKWHAYTYLLSCHSQGVMNREVNKELNSIEHKYILEFLNSNIKLRNVKVNDGLSKFSFSYDDANSISYLSRIGMACLTEIAVDTLSNNISYVIDYNGVKFNYTTYSRYLKNPGSFKLSSNEIKNLKIIHAPHEFDDSCKLSYLTKNKSSINAWLYNECERKKIF